MYLLRSEQKLKLVNVAHENSADDTVEKVVKEGNKPDVSLLSVAGPKNDSEQCRPLPCGPHKNVLPGARKMIG